MNRRRQPACFIGHGVPALLADEADPTNAWLRRFGESLRAAPPRAILCISAHWVAPRLTVTTADAPAITHDHGVPRQGSATYPVLGSRPLARKVMEHLLHAGLDVIGDEARGFDHGAWLPLSAMFPAHDIPLVELSLHGSLDPEVHFAVGRALEPLRDDDVLIIGSGSLTHDLAELERRASTTPPPATLSESSRRFQSWVVDIVTRSAPYARGRGLCRFRDHADARVTHPTEEHLLPLLVIAGAASADKSPDNTGEMVHNGIQLGLSMAAFSFHR